MAELRITGGDLGGRRIRVPRGSRDLRPTTERVREAIFSILRDVSGARVLDLFCGTGALGIEAISRGAAEATLVDTRPAAARRNLEALGLEGRARTIRSDAARFLRRAEEGSFDLVFCDPPYDDAPAVAALLAGALPTLLGEDARIVTESDKRNPLLLPLPLLVERTYGDTRVAIHAST